MGLGGCVIGWVVGLVGNKANLSPSSAGTRDGAELDNSKTKLSLELAILTAYLVKFLTAW